MDRIESAILRWLAILLIPTVAGLSLYVSFLVEEYEYTRSSYSGYVPPNDLYSVVNKTKEATVSITCEGKESSGFGFIFVSNDKARFSFDYPIDKGSIILSNYHSIESCHFNNSLVNVMDFKGRSYFAEIKEVDKENDLAALYIPKIIQELESAWYLFATGYWVMALGSPFGMAGTTTFGNIINMEGNRIFTSASLNKGNSGGPLVDNEGFVMGVNTGYTAIAQNINWAIDINGLCNTIAICSKIRTSPQNSNLLHLVVVED
jgi:S1-C subfamily serine protease